jgi:two-component system, OmpR family, response regulator
MGNILIDSEQPIELEHVRHMFIIDDDEIQREMIKDYMSERYLFTIKCYSTGEEAMADVQSLQPEIIVLDYHLNAHNPSSKNGVEILKQIKSASIDTEVVMFSGEDKLDVALNSMKFGAFDYVVKGESAFNKIEKVIDNLGERHKAKSIQLAQKRTITFLATVILIFIGLGLWYFFKVNG